MNYPEIQDPELQPKLLTGSQVARLLSVNERTIDNLRSSGELKSVKLRRCRRYRIEDVQTYIDALQSE